MSLSSTAPTLKKNYVVASYLNISKVFYLILPFISLHDSSSSSRVRKLAVINEYILISHGDN